MGSNIIQYYINISAETTIGLLLLLLLFSSIWQKPVFKTTIHFRTMLVLMISMLIVQIVTWSFLISGVPEKYGEIPMAVVYSLDYVLYFRVTIALYYYVEAIVTEDYMQKGVIYTPSVGTHKLLYGWWTVTSLLYIIFIHIPSIYHLENGEIFFSIPAYIIMHIVAKFGILCIMILIVRQRKILGKFDTVLCLVFSTLISLLVIVDELFGVCSSYIVLSFFIFIFYVRVDLHKGFIMERQEKEIALWKTQIMLSQMQPHFIYNMLTTISGLCEMQNALEARDVVNRFADYLRTNMDSLGKNKMIPFEKELEHVKTYLWLEKIRFEDAINIRYEIETTDFYLPSLTVQPMVENAVKHGILPKENGGTVTVRTYETDENYVIRVEDDGVGFDENIPIKDGRSHVGIENVRERLEAICRGKFEVNSEVGKGTEITIFVPKGVRL